MAAPVSVLPTLSALAFLEWERDQEGRYEWLDGEVFAMSGGTLRHNALGAAVVGELRLALKGRPCRVLSSDQKIAARPNKHFVYADTSVVCGDRVLAEGTTDVLANPEIVVEVLSTTTESYDRGLKWEATNASHLCATTCWSRRRASASSTSAGTPQSQTRGATGSWVGAMC